MLKSAVAFPVCLCFGNFGAYTLIISHFNDFVKSLTKVDGVEIRFGVFNQTG